MRVLFLDLDGVLNRRRHFSSLPPDRTASEVEYDNSFDRACVARLNAIVERTGCHVVISSTWRLLNSQGKIARCLRRHGFAHERRIIGVTPDLPHRVRGHEIQAWLDAHPGVTAYAILDDNSDMAHLLPRLVQTSFDTGLQDEHVETVVRMLTTEARAA
jgi:hypothetical protein